MSARPVVLSPSFDETDDGLGSAWKFYRRKRIRMVILMFFGFFNSITVRINIVMAITAMVKSNSNPDGEFDWDMHTVGYILSASFYGQLVLTFVGGYISLRYGHTRIFGLSVGVPAFLSIFTQYFARYHYGALIFLRILEGLAQSMTMPSSLGIWALWVPPVECSRLTAFAYAGGYVGIITTMALSGLIIERFGWPSVFIIFGGLGIFWCGEWLRIVYQSPREDPYINPKELNYLKERCVIRVKDIKNPWSKIFSSPPVYALLMCHFSIGWAQYTYSIVPMYLQDVNDISISQAGLESAVPYIALVIVLQIVGYLVYYILKHNLLTLGKVRKLFMCLGFASQGLCFFLMGFANSNLLEVILVACAAGSEAIAEPNFIVNTLEIAPLHASVLLGMSNTVATAAGITNAILTGYIVPNKTRREWGLDFIIAACVSWTASIVYLMFGSSKIQSWALPSLQKTEESSSSEEIS